MLGIKMRLKNECVMPYNLIAMNVLMLTLLLKTKPKYIAGLKEANVFSPWSDKRTANL